MIDPKDVCLYIPDGLKKFKLNLFERIGQKIIDAGGSICRGKPDELDASGKIPIIGCSPELRDYVKRWRDQSRAWIYWDRGYARRVFATWMPKGDNGGYYRWHLNCFQMQTMPSVTPPDRWNSLTTPITDWQHNKDGHIVVALPTPTYEKFHGIQGWTETTLRRLARITTRQVVARDKESKRSLQDDIKGAMCLVTHGSMTAVESVMCGCPVFVHSDSAAALVGLLDIDHIHHPVYPDRTNWLNALAYCQFNETELVDGTLWKMIR